VLQTQTSPIGGLKLPTKYRITPSSDNSLCLKCVPALGTTRSRGRHWPTSGSPESAFIDLTSGANVGAVCTSEGQVVGFCSGAVATGEVLVLAVLPDYEGRGAGKRLLDRVVRRLRDAGAQRLWLAAAADPAVRAHGFYRAPGWRPTGERTGNGDEILELSGQAATHKTHRDGSRPHRR
jgi:ribosomal protein S18 acetylase RimI-like enzyme